MVPVQLRIKNFLSYGPDIQTVNFGPYPLICLSGKNGHGKSALLDAITWSLWGQARKISGTAKPDQGLLHLGQTQMMVVFDFICNATHYRVKREYAQTYGKPLAGLEFGILQEDGTKWVPLTGKTIRETQDVIEKTIRLSYESFTNSAFLRQGQSHEFSTKSPKERKEILATILGLQEYECVRKAAVEKVKHLLAQQTALTVYQEKLQHELTKKEALAQELVHLEHQCGSLHQEESSLATRYELIQATTSSLHQQENVLSITQFKCDQLNNQESTLREQLLNNRKTWRTIQHQLRQAPALEILEQEKLIITQEIATHQQGLHATLKLKEQELHWARVQQEAEKKFNKTYDALIKKEQTTYDRLRMQEEHAHYQQEQLCPQIATKKTTLETYTTEINLLQTRILSAQAASEHKQRLEKQFEKRKTFYHHYRSQGAWFTQELELLKQKQALSLDELNPSCSLCEQNLSASRKKFLHQKFADQELFITRRLKRLTLLVAKLKELLVAQHKQLEEMKKNETEIQLAQRTIAERNQRCAIEQDALTNAETAYALLQEQLTLLKKSIIESEAGITALRNKQHVMLLQDEEYAQASLHHNSINEQYALIHYNQEAHDQAVQKLTLIQEHLQQRALLEQQKLQQQHLFQDVIHLCAQLKNIKHEKKLLEIELQGINELVTKRAQLNKEIADYQAQLKDLQKLKEQLLLHQGRITVETQRLALLEKDLEGYKQEHAQYSTQIEDYQAIAVATSKDGIQALLIEQALPEIEQEANALLSKLTNNQAHIIIESLRDLKKGGAKETLDIKISDAAGIRPYELFSGGEAFRIDFALRIAVSKLLARRAGTSLQTLIIDEGFGSQDEDGLANIMDAIYKIQDDFSKVIIVSHLPSMKENFPVHFCVEKRSHGSIVQVIEQE